MENVKQAEYIAEKPPYVSRRSFSKNAAPGNTINMILLTGNMCPSIYKLSKVIIASLTVLPITSFLTNNLFLVKIPRR